MSGTGWVRLGVLLAAAGLMAAGVLAGHSPDLLVSRMDAGLQTVRDLGGAGRALFAAVQVLVAVSGILPASMLGVAAGVLYGLPAGFLVSGAGTLAGAVLAFALSRSVLRPAVAKFLTRRSRLRELDGMIAREGWRMACLLRVSPVMPFAATSYALGLSSISLRDYVIGTLAAMPALFGYVLLGTLAGSGVAVWSSSNPLGGWMLAFGAIATLVLTLRVGQLVARVVRLDGEDFAS
jgi:uncharacterized membrane protein YdjX (TVP38/TMEM64 family)